MVCAMRSIQSLDSSRKREIDDRKRCWNGGPYGKKQEWEAENADDHSDITLAKPAGRSSAVGSLIGNAVSCYHIGVEPTL